MWTVVYPRAASLPNSVVYHASGYAGFPAATEAARIAAEVFDTTT
ncbi:MAG TPA: hypothetical protein VGN81_40615 [Pseudonocardiaceae bacterium]|jgi:alkylhydroperoxidase/carboxymuconolactone decarboxylase family protein YurZ